MKAGDQTRALVERYYALMDEGRLEDCRPLFHDDVELRIAHHPPITGWDMLLRVMTSGLAVADITHTVGRAWEEDGTAIFEVDATYVFADGRTVVVPGMVVATIEDGRFRKQRIFADLSTVFS
jgi:ketosteroid isomerase-like protein